MPNILFSFLQRFVSVANTLGIEITDSSIKMAEIAVPKHGLPSLKSLQCEPLPAQAVDDGRIQNPLIVTRAVQTLLARINTKTRLVNMVLPSQSIMVRFMKFPDIPLHDLTKLIDFEIKHNIHLPFDEPVYDFVKLNGTEQKKTSAVTKLRKHKTSKPVESEDDSLLGQAAASREKGFDLGSIDHLFGEKTTEAEEQPEEKIQCDVMLVAAPRDLVNEYMQAVQAAGLKVQSIEIKALSLYRVIEQTRFTEPNGTFLTVDINEKATDLSIFHDGILKITRSVPMIFRAANSVPPMLPSTGLFAEFADPDSEFRNTCAELAHELERLMNFYRYTLNNRNQEFEKLLLSGDVPRMHEIAGALREKLSLDVQLFYSDQILAPYTLFEEEFSSYAVPIGLALRGGNG